MPQEVRHYEFRNSFLTFVCTLSGMSRHAALAKCYAECAVCKVPHMEHGLADSA
jgi:hypothetical protein